MPEYTLKIRRYDPEEGTPPFWNKYVVDLEGHRSVLDGILQVKDREDGSLGIRCSCQGRTVRGRGSPKSVKLTIRRLDSPRITADGRWCGYSAQSERSSSRRCARVSVSISR